MPLLCERSTIRSIEANRTVKDAIEASIKQRGSRHRISVTDLVNPMQAYHSRVHQEIEIPLDRLRLLWTGTGFHEQFGEAVSSEEFLEQFVERDGVVGKIDIYDDVPTELKTSSSLPEDLVAQRPSYVDQLGMYCYMAGENEGVVVVYRREDYGRQPGLRAYRVAFADTEAIGSAMREQRDLLLEALEKQDPSRLGRCEWSGRGCDYQAVCPCPNTAIAERVVAADSVSVTEDEELSARLLDAATTQRDRVSPALTLNDLVFPRRAALTRTIGREDDDEDLGSLQRSGFYRVLTEAIRHSEPGAYRGHSIAFEAVRAVIRTHRDVPVIIRSTNTNDMIERDRLPYERPYWIDRLALKTALLEQERGRLVIHYPRVGGGDRFMVYDLGFSNLTRTIMEAKRRLLLLEAQASPEMLPACGPEWLSRYCPFKEKCACL